MTPEQWAAEAALVLGYFHRAALGVGLVLVIVTVVRKWQELTEAKGPIGQVINAALGGVTLVEALFPLYWIVVRGRPISDISSGWLEIYVYVGAVLMLLVGGIGIRSSQS